MDDVLEDSSAYSDNFWDELAASDNESGCSGRPNIQEIDEQQQKQLIKDSSRQNTEEDDQSSPVHSPTVQTPPTRLRSSTQKV